MFHVTKKVKYSAVNFEKQLKHVVVFNLKWIDSTYDCEMSKRISYLNGNVISQDFNVIERMTLDKLNRWIKTMMDIDKGNGYFVDVKI